MYIKKTKTGIKGYKDGTEVKSLEVTKFVMENGGEIPKMHEGGHWMEHAVNPKYKGFCSPMTKKTCTPRRKAFAKTMKKHHGFHSKQMGGDMQQEKWDAIIALTDQGIQDPNEIANQLNQSGQFQTSPEEVQQYMQDYNQQDQGPDEQEQDAQQDETPDYMQYGGPTTGYVPSIPGFHYFQPMSPRAAHDEGKAAKAKTTNQRKSNYLNGIALSYKMENGGSPKSQKMLSKFFRTIIEKKYGGEGPEDSFGMENYIEDKRNIFLNRIQNNANIAMAVKYASDITNPQNESIPKAQMGLQYPFNTVNSGMPGVNENPFALKSFPNASTQFMDGSQNPNWNGNNMADNGVTSWNKNPNKTMLKRWETQYPNFNNNAFNASSDKDAYMNSLTGTSNNKQVNTGSPGQKSEGLNYPNFGVAFNQWDQYANPGIYSDSQNGSKANGNPYNSSQVGIYGNDVQQFQVQNQGQPTVTPQEFNSTKKASLNKYRPFLDNESLVNGSIVAGNQIANVIENMRKKKSVQKTSADYIYTPMDAQSGSRGDYDANSGDFRPDQKVPVQFPGYTAKMGGQNMYKEGGTYMMDEKQIAELKKQGYQIDYL